MEGAVPVYDYKCTKCGERSEHILLGFDAPEPIGCTHCGAPLKRTYGGGRVHISLQGWGFKKTDALLPGDRPRRDFKALKERAERMTDE